MRHRESLKEEPFDLTFRPYLSILTHSIWFTANSMLFRSWILISFHDSALWPACKQYEYKWCFFWPQISSCLNSYRWRDLCKVPRGLQLLENMKSIEHSTRGVNSCVCGVFRALFPLFLLTRFQCVKIDLFPVFLLWSLSTTRVYPIAATTTNQRAIAGRIHQSCKRNLYHGRGLPNSTNANWNSAIVWPLQVLQTGKLCAQEALYNLPRPPKAI